MRILFFACILLSFYLHQECTAVNITKPDIYELKEDIEWIIHREENNLKLLENSYKKITSYYLSRVDDLQYDDTLGRHEEIVGETLVDIKLKLHQVSNKQECAECYSEALGDLNTMFDKFKRDYNQCSISTDSTFNRLMLDFLQFRKANRRIIRRMQKILRMCTFKKAESVLCKRQYIPLKDLNVLANHTYQNENKIKDRTELILQSLRDCTIDAIRPASELAMHFVDTLDKECDFNYGCF